MRDCWYGDSRDIVKWGTLLRLAEDHGVHRILHVAFYRPDEPKDCSLNIGSDVRPIAAEVWEHFRNIRQIQGLAEQTGLDIVVLGEKFTSERSSYFEKVTSHMLSYQDEPLLVFLDPDTGIAPSRRVGLQHVRHDELRSVYCALRTGDIMVFYQHARHSSSWLTDTRNEFATALGIGNDTVTTVTCPEIAHDVAFFVCTR